jgi:hypothetical protein
MCVVREALLSHHYDETPLNTVVRPCSVSLLPSSPSARLLTDIWVYRFWDHEANEARPLTVEDFPSRADEDGD